MNSFFFDSDPFGASGGAVDNDEYYETLGVSKDATAKELRKAYLKLSLKHHPDKGGDVEEFKKITEAHEVLSDPVKRKNYDKFGKKGASGSPFGGGGGGSPEDMFSSMFGGRGGRRGGRRGGGAQQEEGGLRKEKSITHPVHVTLEELYVGKKSHFENHTEDHCLRHNSKRPCTDSKAPRRVFSLPRLQRPRGLCEDAASCARCSAADVNAL
eukprot:INCI9979.1.p3 GENE.INCI9979.1~~INCI9979.1.p3  ORF type:complete len:212 (+),score=47.07 INCI9979.1:156-791(+)